jgi:competence protein ComFC
MNILDRTIGLIAPHTCLACGLEGSVLCQACVVSRLLPHPSRCYRCHQATKQSRVCQRCKAATAISHAWVITEYRETAKQLIHRLKFERASAAAATIAELLAEKLPLLPANIIVTHVPTAQSRIRARGYDQAQLIAKALAKRRNWHYTPLLNRSGSFRQVGASRKQRLKQLEHAYTAQKSSSIHGSHILLIDDVLTTGSTVEAATSVLKAAGAKTIDAAVFAQP